MDLIKGFTIPQLIVVILLLIAWTFGLVQLIFGFLNKAKVSGFGWLIWLTSSVLLAIFKFGAYYYVNYRIARYHDYSLWALWSWLGVAMLPDVLFWDLSGAGKAIFGNLREQPLNWIAIGATMFASSLIVFLPLLRIRMRTPAVS